MSKDYVKVIEWSEGLQVGRVKIYGISYEKQSQMPVFHFKNQSHAVILEEGWLPDSKHLDKGSDLATPDSEANTDDLKSA
jgi:hypothetical protein